MQVVEKAEVPKAPRIGGRDEEFHKQMLQKLALHLAAQPDVPKEPEAGLGDWDGSGGLRVGVWGVGASRGLRVVVAGGGGRVA